jgi:hypothetical protein
LRRRFSACAASLRRVSKCSCRAVALQVAIERQTLKPVFSLDR